MSLHIPMNLYTKRERQALTTGSPTAVEDLNIEPMKVKVAEMFDPVEWDMWYFRCRSVANALAVLSEYHPAARIGDWVWCVPRTPRVVTYGNGERELKIRPMAHPARLNEFLEVIWDRPRDELRSIISILKKLPLPGVLDLEMESLDDKNSYWELSWAEPKYENSNVIFLHRG